MTELTVLDIAGFAVIGMVVAVGALAGYAWQEHALATRQRIRAEEQAAWADELSQLRAQVAAWESAVRTARLNNPYSLDAFTPVSQDDWARLSDLVLAELGHGIDRYSAACMVMAWDGCTAAIEAMATEAIEG